tara:strand:- start:5524 stop:5895 length:372 start_codon:yes stop_codon:yes gene_type:complete
MATKPKGFPTLAQLAEMDAMIVAKGAHFVSSNVALVSDTASQNNAKNDNVPHLAIPTVKTTELAVTQSALPTTHGKRTRVTGYIDPGDAYRVHELMAALDRSESWVVGALVAEAIAARLAKGI